MTNYFYSSDDRNILKSSNKKSNQQTKDLNSNIIKHKSDSGLTKNEIAKQIQCKLSSLGIGDASKQKKIDIWD